MKINTIFIKETGNFNEQLLQNQYPNVISIKCLFLPIYCVNALAKNLWIFWGAKTWCVPNLNPMGWILLKQKIIFKTGCEDNNGDLDILNTSIIL